MNEATIVALSSGSLPSGVAVIRLSGPLAFDTVNRLCGQLPNPRRASLKTLIRPSDGVTLDQALVLVFPAPNSFTGDDVVELHCHGGWATVDAVLSTVLSFDSVRLAEAGEFSRRAFENGRMDLTELEGLSDLIAAQTENQRRFALRQAEGSLHSRLEEWRGRIIRARAFLEAQFDFTDEEDIQRDENRSFWSDVETLRLEIAAQLSDGRAGEIAREGFRIAFLGAPNAGKSSLLNALANRDVAIVTDVPGTTRDVLDVHLNIDGHLVLLQDTAGIRDTNDVVEQEGIRRAKRAATGADLLFWLNATDETVPDDLPKNTVLLRTKADQRDLQTGNDPLTISTVQDEGLTPLLSFLSDRLASFAGADSDTLITRQRHREELTSCESELAQALNTDLDVELRTDHLRRAGDALGRLTGRIDTEDLLDVIFSEFCVGK